MLSDRVPLKGVLGVRLTSGEPTLMTPSVKSAILGLVLMAGTAASAYAQSDNVAALPRQMAVTPAPAVVSVIQPTAFLGPDPGANWTANAGTPAQVEPSQQFSVIQRNGLRNDEE